MEVSTIEQVINFAGPAPRPLAHFEMSVDHSGRLIVNKSKVVPTETELIV
jgi:cytochrome b6-f complex iron-sulfur subunit